jgi:flagellar basal-body rod protein FlgF
MKCGIYSATAGMMTSVERLDVIANNIANINTAGYKNDMPFEQVIKFLSEGPYPGKDQPVLAGSVLDMSNGVIKTTGRSLDLAFEGPGMFVVRNTDGGQLYTRNGAFDMNAKRELVTADGLQVLDKFNRPVTLYGQSYSITPRGEVMIDGSYATTLKTVAATDAAALKKVGSSYLQAADGAQAPAELANPELAVGALEQSNINMMEELASMITAQRAFEFQSRAVETILTQTLRRTVSDLPRPS